MNEKLEQAKTHIKTTATKVKNHVVDHKEAYIAGTAAATVAAVAVYVVMKTRQTAEAIVTTDSNKLVDFKWNSPTTNNVTTVLIRRGHPGNIIRCVQTGEIFSSQNRAAEVMGISPSNLSQHLQGKQPSVGGFVFEILGEAQ